jgi:hypothetical protein
MGVEDRTRARAAIDAVSDKHRALSAMVGAATIWAAAVALRTGLDARDVAWLRATAELGDDVSAGAWMDSELRDYSPLVVGIEYAAGLAELHDDLCTAGLGPAAYKSIAGLAPAKPLRTVKHLMDLAWRADREAHVFEGRLAEAAYVDQEMRQRHDEWVAEVDCAVDVLEDTGFQSLWMRPYRDSVTDRLRHAVPMFHEVYAALARAQFEPLVLTEWKRRNLQLEKAVLESWGPGDQEDVRVAITHRVAAIIDDWIGSLLAGGLSEQERDVTARALDDQYPDAMMAWRGICAARVANRHPALQIPKAFYTEQWERSAS